MAIPILPVAIGLLVGGVYLRKKARFHGEMTPERTKIFNAAISGGMQDPDNLDKLAKLFAEQGLSEQANLLRQRARLRRLPNDIKLVRRQIWRKAIKSTNKPGMQKLADAYDREGCSSAAMRLREIISGLPDRIPEATESGEEAGQPEESPEDQATA